MFALGIASFALLTMIGVYSSGLHLAQRSRQLTTGTDICREFLETVKEQGISTIPNEEVVYDARNGDPGHATLPFPPGPYPEKHIDGQRYQLVVRVRPLSDELRSITVQAYYGVESRVTLQTLVR